MKLLRDFLILVTIFFCFKLSAQDQSTDNTDSLYKDALREWTSGNYDIALRDIEKLANGGNSSAQNKLGNLYLHGDHVVMNLEKAFGWFKKSAEQNNIDGIDNLAWAYRYGKGVKQDLVAAANLFKKSADMGSSYGQCQLGMLYKNGEGIDRDLEKAFSLFQKSALQGRALGQFYLGVMYGFGEGVTKNLELSNYWYRKSTDQGNSDAAFNLGRNYEIGMGVFKNELEAAKLYIRAAEKNHSDAQWNLALMYEDGRGVSKDYSAAAALYENLCKINNEKAKYRLASLLENGKGVEKNIDRAIQLYRESAHAGYLKAQSQLGWLLIFSEEIKKKEVKEGLDWLTRAVQQGSQVAQYNLGRCYASGIGVPKNDSTAFEYFNQSAKQGYRASVVELGLMFYEGRGVNKNVVEAAKLFKNAADLGSETGKRNIQIIYRNHEIKEKIGIPALDSLLTYPLKFPLTEIDIKQIKQYAKSCYSILGILSLNISVFDFAPPSDRIKEEPATQKRLNELLGRVSSEGESFDLIYSIANIYQTMKKWQEASNYLKKADSITFRNLTKRPTDPQLHFDRSLVLFAKEQYNEALKELQMVNWEATNMDAEFLKVLCYLSMGDAEAVKTFGTSLIKKDGLDINGYLILTLSDIPQVLQRLKTVGKNARVEDIADFHRIDSACNAHPDDLKLHFLKNASKQMALAIKIAHHNEDQRNFSKGFQLTFQDKQELIQLEDFYLKTVNSNTKNVSIFLTNKLLAIVYLLSGQFDNSIRYCRNALEAKEKEGQFMYSKKSEIYELMATAYLLAGDTIKSKNVVKEKIIKEQEYFDNADSYVSLSKYDLWSGDMKGVEKNCQNSIIINSLSQEAYLGLAITQLLSNDIEGAQDYLLKARSSGPDNPQIETVSGIISVHVQDYTQAYDWFKRALKEGDSYEPAKKILDKYFVKELKADK